MKTIGYARVSTTGQSLDAQLEQLAAVPCGLVFRETISGARTDRPELRRALFLVMDCLLKTQPQDDPVYRFMDKKRAEGKPYLVYMTAGANKFLRIYYGRVKEYLAQLENS